MPIKDLNFACVCLKHGIEVHDGSKNECCDEAVIIPMMNEENFESLTDKGQEMFEHDLMRIDELVNGNVETNLLRESKDFAKWWRGTAVEILMPKLTESKQAPEQEARQEGFEDAEMTVGSMEPIEELADNGVLEHYYMLGYTAGFSAGFERGFDTGHKLSVVRKS